MTIPAPFAIPSPLNVVARQWREYYLAVAEQLGEALESLENANAALTSPLPMSDPFAANTVAVAWRTQYTNALTQVVTLQAQIASLQQALSVPFPGVPDVRNVVATNWKSTADILGAQVVQLQAQLGIAQDTAEKTRSLHIRATSNFGPSSGYGATFFTNLQSSAVGFTPVNLVPAQFTFPNIAWIAGRDQPYAGVGTYPMFLTVEWTCSATHPPTVDDPWEFVVTFLYRDSQFNQDRVGYGLWADNDGRSAVEFGPGCLLMPEQSDFTYVPDIDVYENSYTFFRYFRFRSQTNYPSIRLNFRQDVTALGVANFSNPVAQTFAPENFSIWDLRVSMAPPN